MAEIPIIKNKAELATSERRRQALEIIEAGIRRVLPGTIMERSVSFDPFSSQLVINKDIYQLKGRLFVVGGGKASGLMSQTLESLIDPARIEAGIVVDKADADEFETRKIKVIQAGHPVPDSRGVEAVQQIINLKNLYSIGREDIVLCLLSGGGSSLLPFPADGVSLNDKQQVTRLLLACGADIYEINSVRKHLSQIKGGRLAQHFAPARVISLILSDVIGNDLSVIASGLTFPDPSTYTEAYAVLRKYGLLDDVPASVLQTLERGCRGEIEETPKSLDNVNNYIIGDVRLALEAMAEQAGSLGLKPLIISSCQSGDTVTAARQRAAEIVEGAFKGYNALLLGGETTPRLPSHPGKGGRNQHFAALTPSLLKDYPRRWVLASAGTDGSDFLPDVAGAIVDQNSLSAFHRVPADHQAILENFDSNTLLLKAGHSLIITGNTHTNVGDILVYLLD